MVCEKILREKRKEKKVQKYRSIRIVAGERTEPKLVGPRQLTKRSGKKECPYCHRLITVPNFLSHCREYCKNNPKALRKLYKCPFCNLLSPYSYNVTQHIRIKHRDPVAKYITIM